MIKILARGLLALLTFIATLYLTLVAGTALGLAFGSFEVTILVVIALVAARITFGRSRRLFHG